MRHLSVLVKPASSLCNLNCNYCFYYDVANNRKEKSTGIMTRETLEQLVKRVFEFADASAGFAFQGGEPTLAGLEYFQEFIKLVQYHNKHKIPVHLSMQTNGMLIDHEWALFLKEHDFLVGLSLDGPDFIHDKYRRGFKQETSHKRVMETMSLLKKHHVEFNVLQVVTKETVKHLKEVYNFYKNNGIEFLQISPVLDQFKKGRKGHDYSLDNETLADFLIGLFDIWYADFKLGNAVRVTYFEQIISKKLGHFVPSCAMNGKCSIQTVIESDGSIYPCDFYAMDPYSLGNIHEDSFMTVLMSQEAKDFVLQSEKINKSCLGCKWYGLCMGSCKRYKSVSKSKYKSKYCSAYKSFFSHMDSVLDMKDFV